MLKLEINTYDQLVAKLEDKKAIAETTKMEKQEELRSKLGSAKIASVKAKAALEKAIVTSGVSIDAAALDYKTALETEEFYVDLNDLVFGEDKVVKSTTKANKA